MQSSFAKYLNYKYCNKNEISVKEKDDLEHLLSIVDIDINDVEVCVDKYSDYQVNMIRFRYQIPEKFIPISDFMEWFECKDIENTIISKPIIDHDLFLDLSIQFVDKPDELESKLNKYFGANISSKWLFDKIKSVIIYRSNALRVPEPSGLFKRMFDGLPEKIIGDDRFNTTTRIVSGFTKFDLDKDFQIIAQSSDDYLSKNFNLIELIFNKDDDTSEILKFYLNSRYQFNKNVLNKIIDILNKLNKKIKHEVFIEFINHRWTDYIFYSIANNVDEFVKIFKFSDDIDAIIKEIKNKNYEDDRNAAKQIIISKL